MTINDTEFTGQALWDLIVAIEGAIGARKAGCTPLGRAVTDLCEAVWKRDQGVRDKVASIRNQFNTTNCPVCHYWPCKCPRTAA